MKWENNDLVMKQHNEVKGLPHDDSILVRPTSSDLEPKIEEKNETSSTSPRIREINDFC